MSNSSVEEPVKFRVVMTSDAAIKEVSLATSTTKLSELKEILANEKYFGSKAPVWRQRLFHLGRELKSGGRSLCNLGLGKFNNRILHLYIRPDNQQGGNASGAQGACSRKRCRAAASQQPEQDYRRQRPTNDAIETIAISGGRIDQGSTTSQPVASTNNNSTAIDLVDSSDEDEVEVIEVL